MMNNFCGVGRLTRDPETRTAGDAIVVNFTIAIDRAYVKQGEERQADFLPIVVFGKTAEFAEKYFKKGSQVSVVGRVQTRSYDDSNGNKRYVTEIIASQLGFADTKKDTNPSPAESYLAQNAPSASIIDDDSLPF